MSASVQTQTSEASVAIKRSLCHFINKNVPTADVTMIDDIVLSYVVAIIEEASQDSCFDVDGFIELMISYVPDFMAIDAEQVYNWLVEVEAEIVHLKQEAEKPDIMPSCSMMLPEIGESGPSSAQASKPGRSRNSVSESSDDMEEHVIVFECPEYAEQCMLLKDLFPNTCMLEIKHCMSIADGDVEVAAATLLLRRDNGQEITAAALHAPHGKSQVDDVTLKYRIIERYSYVDKNSGKKEHRPLAPKSEPKKMVRYRDGKIVSLKGEKYTEVSKSGAEEENLKKPKKHSP